MSWVKKDQQPNRFFGISLHNPAAPSRRDTLSTVLALHDNGSYWARVIPLWQWYPLGSVTTPWRCQASLLVYPSLSVIHHSVTRWLPRDVWTAIRHTNKSALITGTCQSTGDIHFNECHPSGVYTTRSRVYARTGYARTHDSRLYTSAKCPAGHCPASVTGTRVVLS